MKIKKLKRKGKGKKCHVLGPEIILLSLAMLYFSGVDKGR